LEQSNGNFSCSRAARDFGIRYGKCVSRIGTGDAHEREVTNVYAAGFPSICSSGDGMPFIYKQALMLMIQQPDKITMLYSGGYEARRVRLNEPHPSPLTPS
jgi:hypothetical protein